VIVSIGISSSQPFRPGSYFRASFGAAMLVAFAPFCRSVCPLGGRVNNFSSPKQKQESSRFLKKAAQKLLLKGARGSETSTAPD
jgi:hypothetical protein